MDKYRKIVKSADISGKDETEVRCKAIVSNGVYLSRVARLFGEMDKSCVTITGTGNAISKVVHVAEIVKRRFKGLHQITKLGSTEIVDEYEPLEEGLDTVTDTRVVSCVEIKLSKEPLDTSDKGYQPPLDESEVKEYDVEELPRGRGRGKGSRSANGKGKRNRKGSGGTTTTDAEEDEPEAKGKNKGNRKGTWKGKRGRVDTGGTATTVTTVTTDGGEEFRSKGRGKAKNQGTTKGKKAGFSQEETAPIGWGKKGRVKGKSKAMEASVEEQPKGKGKAKGRKAEYQSIHLEEPKGKGKGKAFVEEQLKRKGKAKGKKADYQSTRLETSKGKGKGKGKSSGYDDEWWGYEEGMFSKSASRSNYAEQSWKGKGKAKESAKPLSSGWDDRWDSYPSARGEAMKKNEPSYDGWGYSYENPASGKGSRGSGNTYGKSKGKGNSEGKGKSWGKGEYY